MAEVKAAGAKAAGAVRAEAEAAVAAAPRGQVAGRARPAIHRVVGERMPHRRSRSLLSDTVAG